GRTQVQDEARGRERTQCSSTSREWDKTAHGVQQHRGAPAAMAVSAHRRAVAGREGTIMHPRLTPRAFRHPVSKETIRRDLLLSAAGITFVVAALVYFVVIPLLADATAVGDLRYNAAFNLVVCGFILAVTHLAAHGKGVFLLVPAGLAALVLGVFLLGGALAAGQHGPSTQGALVALFVCAAGDLVAGVLTLVGVVLGLPAATTGRT